MIFEIKEKIERGERDKKRNHSMLKFLMSVVVSYPNVKKHDNINAQLDTKENLFNGNKMKVKRNKTN